jgi:hypothetical protein
LAAGSNDGYRITIFAGAKPPDYVVGQRETDFGVRFQLIRLFDSISALEIDDDNNTGSED